MAEYEVERPIALPAAVVFDVASDIGRMQDWLPTAMNVESAGPNQVHVEGAAGGEHYSATGLIGVRHEQRRLEWGSQDSPDYAGWLQVSAAGDGESSSVTLHLSFLGDQEQAREHGGAPQRMYREMEEALERLEQVALPG